MNTSEHCKEVYAYFGLAMYRAQCVEQSIVQLLIFSISLQKMYLHFLPVISGKQTLIGLIKGCLRKRWDSFLT